MVRICKALKFETFCRAFCIFAMSASLLSCTTKREEANLTITLPDFSNSSSQAMSQSVSAQSSGDGDWGLVDPTSISQFDCFAIFVGANEPELNRYQCLDQNDNFMYRFGVVAGLASKGSTLSLTVPSGPQRTINLVGLDLAEGATCESLGANGDITSSQYSAPFLLASSTVDLVPGDVTVTLNAAYNPAKKVGDCDFGNGTNSGPSGISLGSGSDGDVTLTGSTSIDVTTYTLPNTRKFSAIKRITAIAPAANPGEFNVSLQSNANASQFAPSDEVMLYIAAASPGGPPSSCGDLYPGFRVEGKVTSFVPGTNVVTAHFYDSRVGTIPSVNLGANASTNDTFCRAILVRVPHFNNLTLNFTTGGNLFVPPFGSLADTDHQGGVLMMRVKGVLKSIGSTGIVSASAAGFAQKPLGLPGESVMGYPTLASLSANGSGGGGSTATLEYPGGGGHGGVGGSGSIANGGYIEGDQYGCNSSVPDPNRPCLFGKMFFGSAGGTYKTTSTTTGIGGGLVAVFANKIEVLTGKSLSFKASAQTGSQVKDAGSAGGSVLVRALDYVITGNMYLHAAGSNAGSSVDDSAGAGAGGRAHIDFIRDCTTAATSSITFVIGGGVSGPGYATPRPAPSGTRFMTGAGMTKATCILPP